MKIQHIFLTIAALCILYYAFQQYLFYRSTEEQSNNWYITEYKLKEINGTLSDLTFSDRDSTKVVISIKNRGEIFELSYGATCVDTSFLNFVEIGDSVFKAKNSKFIKFCSKKLNICKYYKINFCGEFDDIND